MNFSLSCKTGNTRLPGGVWVFFNPECIIVVVWYNQQFLLMKTLEYILQKDELRGCMDCTTKELQIRDSCEHYLIELTPDICLLSKTSSEVSWKEVHFYHHSYIVKTVLNCWEKDTKLWISFQIILNVTHLRKPKDSIHLWYILLFQQGLTIHVLYNNMLTLILTLNFKRG